jgi:hypothetical protein
MAGFLSKYSDKLFFKQWTIGFCKGDISEIIRSRSFDPEIHWLPLESYDYFIADPFFVTSINGRQKLLFEELNFRENYGKIALMTLDGSYNKSEQKYLLDTGLHLSYPFVYYENNKVYIFPEASKSGKLSCYQYDPLTESLTFLKDIIDMPLRDSTILKYRDKYWLFGIIAINDKDYKLHVFYSDNFLGPYTSHKNNPVKDGLNGTRPAGNMVIVDGEIYRPAQNCENSYGESMVINRITELTEENVSEVTYMNITLNRKRRSNRLIHSMHTINQSGDMIVLDGEKWTFAPLIQLKKFIGDIPAIKKYSQKKEQSQGRSRMDLPGI